MTVRSMVLWPRPFLAYSHFAVLTGYQGRATLMPLGENQLYHAQT
jgi:hypothetical protein